MFRQGGMSKQPMGILASSPELMTTAQKAMMKGQPVKAQNGTFIKDPDKMNSPMINYFRQNSPLEAIGGFVSDTADKFMTNNKIIADMINKGLLIGSPDGKRDDTPTFHGYTLPEMKKEGESFAKDKAKALSIKKDDSQFMKDIKKIGSSIDTSLESTINNIDKGLDYFRNKKEIETADDIRLKGIQKSLNLKAEGDSRYQFTDQSAGPQRLEPPKKGEERGLVDPNVLSSADPRFPESFPESRPEEVLGLSVINKIKEDAKNPKGTTTKGADDALGISDLSFKDRVKARREIISAALGRDISEKDVRTDANYNLIMTGLLVAAGESPNAMTNIAKGLAAGLAGYGKAKGEATEAKRKEDIAVGLAAVEQVFKESEAEKSRDKKPEAIRTAEYLRDNPELMTIMKGISSKNKSDEQIKLEIATALAKSSIDPSAVNVGMIDTLFKAVKGQTQTPQTPTVIPSYRVDPKVVGTDRFKPGNIITSNGFNYVVSDDGLTLNLDTTQKSS
jgi:hypothetical protein